MEGQAPAQPPANDETARGAELAALMKHAGELATNFESLIADGEASRTAAQAAVEQLESMASAAQNKSAEVENLLGSVLSRISDLEAEIAAARVQLAQAGTDSTTQAAAKLTSLDEAIASAKSRGETAANDFDQRGQAGLALIESAVQQANARRDEAVAAANAVGGDLARGQQLVNEIQTLRAEVEAHQQVTTQAAAAKQGFEQEAAAILGRYQASLADADQRKQEFEESYAASKEDVERLTAQAETMLFGATNAGIASTFKEEVAALDRRIRDAERMFLFGLFTIAVSLIPLIVYMFNVTAGEALTIESVLARTALLIPSVWLTRHFARRVHANFELRQQYVHKYSMGAIVEPFRRQAGEHAPNVVAGVAEELMKNPASVLKRHQKMGDGPAEDMSEVLKPVTRLLPNPDRQN